MKQSEKQILLAAVSVLEDAEFFNYAPADIYRDKLVEDLQTMMRLIDEAEKAPAMPF